MKIRTVLRGLIFSIAAWQMPRTACSAMDGLAAHLKSMIARASGYGFASALWLNRPTQSAVGMRASFRPGVSMRLKLASSLHVGC